MISRITHHESRRADACNLSASAYGILNSAGTTRIWPGWADAGMRGGEEEGNEGKPDGLVPRRPSCIHCPRIGSTALYYWPGRYPPTITSVSIDISRHETATPSIPRQARHVKRPTTHVALAFLSVLTPLMLKEPLRQEGTLPLVSQWILNLSSTVQGESNAVSEPGRAP